MEHVYILRSNNGRLYIGLTNNLEKRIKEHNHGKSFFTKRDDNWQIICSIAFRNRSKAAQFEKYLKTGSGKAFFKKRLI